MKQISEDIIDKIDLLIEDFNMIDTNPIATEGFVDDLKNSLATKATISGRHINTWYSKILLNVNHFKNAQLDEEQNKDLIKVLNMAQPRTELNFKLFPRYYEYLKMIGNMEKRIDGKPFGLRSGTMIELRKTTLENEITKSIADVRGALKSAQESKEYKRIKRNKYSNDRMQNIPLSGIVSDMKKTKASAAVYQNHLDAFNKKIQEMEKIDKVTEKMAVFLNIVMSYYKFRISLLTVYFDHAKASLKGTIRNVVDSDEDQFKTSQNTQLDKAKWLTKKMKPEEVKHLQEVYHQALKAKPYSAYKPLYEELTVALGLKGKIIRKMKFEPDKGLIHAYWVNTNTQKINVGSQKLYHGVPGHVTKTLTSLRPSYCGIDGYMFPEPRIYFHIGVPLNRCSNKPDPAAGERSYTPTEPITTVWKDNELGGTAVYVQTTKNIPVKPVQLKRRDTILDKQIDKEFEKMKGGI